MCTLFCIANNFFGVFFMKRTFKFLPLILCAVMGLAVFLSACGDNNQTTPPAHEHTFATAWTTDGTHHWYAATCEHNDQIKDKAAHDFEGDTCKVCNYTKPHKHTFATTWTTSETHHWYAATCEHTDQTKDKAAHNFDGGETCKVCNYTKPHEHTFATVWTSDETHHWYAATCEHTNETKDKAAHDFDGNKCTVCDYEKPLTWDDIYNDDIINLFNEKLTVGIVLKMGGQSGDDKNIKDTIWYITKENETIKSTNVVFIYDDGGNTNNYISLFEINFTSPLTPQDIQNENVGTQTYTEIYGKFFNPQIQEQHTALTNAICNKLFGAKTDATRYIIDNGVTTLDPTLGKAARYTVIEITDTEAQEMSISIKYADTSASIIENLNDTTKYRTYEEKTVSITGEKL